LARRCHTGLRGGVGATVAAIRRSPTSRLPPHHEAHRLGRAGWLRAAVLGANDGIVSTAALLVGVAAAASDHGQVMIGGVAGLVAGAMSMAAGEYVSVSSQADAERADLAREAAELATDPEGEAHELAAIYRERGLDADVAATVAAQLMAKDPLAAHARDELGLSEALAARPVQAALASAAAFAGGAGLPLLVAALVPLALLGWAVTAAALLGLGLLGLAGARIGGAPAGRATMRVLAWGALAMAASALVGKLFGAVV
jgi:vacuolar iron transporter family protein